MVQVLVVAVDAVALTCYFENLIAVVAVVKVGIADSSFDVVAAAVAYSNYFAAWVISVAAECLRY